MPERLTPEETKARVEKHGSQRAAARAYGVSQPTISYWLDPAAKERKREYRQRPEVKSRGREYRRERYSARKARGVCTKCGGELDPGSITRCSAHLEVLREYNFLYVRL